MQKKLYWETLLYLRGGLNVPDEDEDEDDPGGGTFRGVRDVLFGVSIL